MIEEEEIKINNEEEAKEERKRDETEKAIESKKRKINALDDFKYEVKDKKVSKRFKPN